MSDHLGRLGEPVGRPPVGREAEGLLAGDDGRLPEEEGRLTVERFPETEEEGLETVVRFAEKFPVVLLFTVFCTLWDGLDWTD